MRLGGGPKGQTIKLSILVYTKYLYYIGTRWLLACVYACLWPISSGTAELIWLNFFC